MITLYHSPRTRSTRIVALLAAIERLDQVDLHFVHVPRRDGSGGRDPANPHPEGKVPMLVAGGEPIRESNAIALYLTDRFGGPLGRAVGAPGRGRYVSWLAWYGNVLEPVMVAQFAGFADNPVFHATFRGVPEALSALSDRLEAQPYLVDDAPSAADLLIASPFHLFPGVVPVNDTIAAWVARVAPMLDAPQVVEVEARACEALGLPVEMPS